MEREVAFLAREALQTLLDVLHAQGYRCIAPQVRDGAIVFDTLASVDALPHGVRDAQAPGSYRLEQRGDALCFAWAAPAQSVKPWVFQPEETLWRCERDDSGLRFEPDEPEPVPLAVLGARACDLAGLYLQDRHFLRETLPDPHYRARRRHLFLVAVHCTHPAETCFCVSTGDGPRAAYGYDLALTELEQGFLVEWRSAAGRTVWDALPLRPATAEEIATGQAAVAAAARRQQRRLPAASRLRTLFDRLEDARWEEVAARCLGCGNCTAVCPSCFCFREEETAEGFGDSPHASVHRRCWDSCFDPGHSYLHGWVVRPDLHTRYRQWLTHKLAGWQMQYGRPGCTGCGRCITWCPVGIDLVAEARALCGEGTDD